MNVLLDFSNPLVWLVWIGIIFSAFTLTATIIVSAKNAVKHKKNSKRKKN